MPRQYLSTLHKSLTVIPQCVALDEDCIPHLIPYEWPAAGNWWEVGWYTQDIDIKDLADDINHTRRTEMGNYRKVGR